MRCWQLAATDLEERGPSGDALQRTRVDATSPLSLCCPQLSVADHGGGGEGVGVATTGAITGLSGGGRTAGGQEVRMQGRWEWRREGRDDESENGLKDETGQTR